MAAEISIKKTHDRPISISSMFWNAVYRS